MPDSVIILHGIFRTRRSMRGLAAFLEQSGFRVLNLGYPSTRHGLAELAVRIHPQISRFIAGSEGRVHYVGFSMGGLLIRAYLNKYRPERLGRVVMIGTPNGGSKVADALKNLFLYKKFYGPAGQQLVTDQQSFAHALGDVYFELGVIAGNRPIDPVASRIIGQPNDGRVSVESTRVRGMKEHLVLPCNHTFFPSSRAMWRQVACFLQQGAFSPLRHA